MSQLSRGTRVAIRSTKRLCNFQPRRFDSHHAPHGSSESALHVAGGTGRESMGVRFAYPFLSLTALIASPPERHFHRRRACTGLHDCLFVTRLK